MALYYISTRERDRIKSLIRSSKLGSDRSIIIVAATPVIGSSAEELLQRISRHVEGPENRDVESFDQDYGNFCNLFSPLLDNRVSQAVILSGDVHFSFRGNGFIRRPPQNNNVLSIWQFVSSPLKNDNDPTTNFGRGFENLALGQRVVLREVLGCSPVELELLRDGSGIRDIVMANNFGHLRIKSNRTNILAIENEIRKQDSVDRFTLAFSYTWP